MSDSTRMNFVGGQEDGRFYDVRNDVDMVSFHEQLDFDILPFTGEIQVDPNAVVKIIRYVRQGDVMVCEE